MRLVEILYVLSAILLAVYGYNSLILALLRVKMKEPFPIKKNEGNHDWPAVTVQLPVYNERYVIEDLIEAVGNLNYPRDRLQIQVLDDSTDTTKEIIAQAVNKQRLQGLDIEHVQRPDRSGYKGGALEFGLSTTKGEYIAIFDADFLPQQDFLQQIMPYFYKNPQIGCLQARWGHINRDASLLTQAQANGIDGHFMIEQEVRSEKQLFLNFNGTAGVWRKTCIEDAGGWHHDTLTEDLDLSYRAQLKGWQIKYIPQVIVPAELPIHINAFKRQQFRWAKGSIQTARKLLRDLWGSSHPTIKKVEGTIHLTNYIVHPLMLINLLLSLPLIIVKSPLLWVLPIFLFAAIGPLLMYWIAMRKEGQTIWGRITSLAMLLLLGMGLSLNNSRAVFEALVGRKSAFLRTPKFNISDIKISEKINEYLLPRDPFAWVEILFAIYTSGLLIYAISQGVWSLTVWLILFASGYTYVASLNFRKI